MWKNFANLIRNRHLEPKFFLRNRSSEKKTFDFIRCLTFFFVCVPLHSRMYRVQTIDLLLRTCDRTFSSIANTTAYCKIQVDFIRRIFSVIVSDFMYLHSFFRFPHFHAFEVIRTWRPMSAVPVRVVPFVGVCNCAYSAIGAKRERGRIRGVESF